MIGKKGSTVLLFLAECRAGEWCGPEPEDSAKVDPVLVESKNMIVIVVDAFEDAEFTKIILSKN